MGDAAPEFVLKDDTGAEWKSTEYFGKRVVVLFFYPADLTKGCTKQACGFRDELNQFKDRDVLVIGVSGDSVRNHQLFKQVHELNFTLLADEEGAVADKFGVPVTRGEKSVTAEINGKNETLTRQITTSRVTFVIDKRGKIAYRNDQVNVNEDSQQVARVVEGLAP